MELTKEQQEKVKGWAAEGASLSEIQSRISGEFGIRLSYMDTRFLVIDLNAAIKDKEEPRKQEPKKQEPMGKTDEADETEGDEAIETEPLGKAEGGVSVALSNLARPGFALTGTVVFSDGVNAGWGITNDGRISFEPQKEGYRPSHEDMKAFQLKLRELISAQGY